MCKKLIVLTSFLTLLVVSANAVMHNPADPTLIAYYKLDNNANDSSGNGYTGSMFYNLLDTATDQIRYRNQAGEFVYGTHALRVGNPSVMRHGLNAGIEIPNDALVDWQNGQTGPPAAGTIACWVRSLGPRTDQTEAYRFIFGLEGGCGASTACPTGGGRHRLQMWLGGNKQYDSNLNIGLGDMHTLDQDIITLQENTWYHVALVIKSAGGGNPENGTYKVYVDGAPMPPGLMTTIVGYSPDNYKNLNTLIGTSGQCPDPNDANCTRPMDIGNVGRARTQGYRGHIDEFGIYDRELSRLELAALADADANQACVPNPPHNAVDVLPDVVLSWLAGLDANAVSGHDVYFGTNPAPDPNEFKLNQTAKTYDPAGAGYLDLLKDYYWRIDEVNLTTVTGKVWKFTTGSGAPTYDYPKDGAAGPFAPNPDLTLDWTPAGAYNTSFDVYVSTNYNEVTDSCSVAQKANDIAASQLQMLPPLSLGTTYYWKIIANHTSGISPSSTSGPVYSFTTGQFYVVEDFEPYLVESGTPTPAVSGNWAKTGGLLYYYLITTDSAKFPGKQSLDIALQSQSPYYYTGIQRTYGYNNDYSINNTAKSMAVWYKADTNTNRLFARLGDGTNSDVITNSSPTKNGQWNEWNIAFTDFTGVDVSSITTIEVGEGDKEFLATPGSSTGRLRLDDIRLYMPRYLTPLYGDADGDYTVNWEDVRLLAQDWQTTNTVNLVKNPRFDDGPNPADANWPVDWTLYHATAIAASNYGELAVDTSDAPDYTLDGVPVPCARVDRNQPVVGWVDSDLTQMIDVTSLMNQTLEISFDHKADVEAPDNCMFEFRLAFSTNTALSSNGPTYIQRKQEGHDPYCPTCYGSFRWDWESYSMAMEVTESYLHIDFRLAGRGDTNADPNPWIKIDNVVVKVAGSSLNQGDINGNGPVDFRDHVLLANDWLVAIPAFP